MLRSLASATIFICGAFNIKGAPPPEPRWSVVFPNIDRVQPLAIQGDRLICWTSIESRFELMSVGLDGQIKWRRPDIFVYPTLAMDKTGNIYFQNSSELVALDKDNQVLWKYELWRGGSRFPPVMTSGDSQLFSLSHLRTYGPQVENRLYLVKLSNAGEPSLYNEISYLAGDQNTYLWHGALAATKSGRLYCAANSVLKAFDETGRLLWEYGLYPVQPCAPAVDAAGVIYVQTRDSLIAVDANGKTRWRTVVDPPVLQSIWDCPASIAGDRIYASWPSLLCCLTRSGAIVWKKNYYMQSQPRIASDGSLYLCCVDQGLTCLICTDGNGNEKWRTFSVNGPMILGEDGTVYVGVANTLHALKGAAPGPHPWPMEGASATRHNVAMGSGFIETSVVGGRFAATASAEGVDVATLETSTDFHTWTPATDLDLTYNRRVKDQEVEIVPKKFFRLKEAK